MNSNQENQRLYMGTSSTPTCKPFIVNPSIQEKNVADSYEMCYARASSKISTRSGVRLVLDDYQYSLFLSHLLPGTCTFTWWTQCRRKFSSDTRVLHAKWSNALLVIWSFANHRSSHFMCKSTSTYWMSSAGISLSE